MGIKLLWVGLTIVVALNLVLELVGLKSNPVLTQVGAVIMVIGAIALILDK